MLQLLLVEPGIGAKTCREDDVASSTVRQLRQRLDQYFEGPGLDEPLRITIPRGYPPVFEPGTSATQHNATGEPPYPELSKIVAPINLRSRFEPQPHRNSISKKSLAFLFIGLLCGALAGGIWGGTRLKAYPKTSAPSIAHALWTQLFTGNSTTYVVTEDAGLQVLQDITGHQSTLTQYIDGSYPG